MIVPIFPLNLVVFPGERVPLRIFEPRYKQLTRYCLSEDQGFGIPVVLKQGIQPFGTFVKITEITRTLKDGQMDISVVGIRSFFMEEVEEPSKNRLYHSALIRWHDPHENGESELQIKIAALYSRLHELLRIKGKPFHEQRSFYEIVHYIGMSLEQKYRLLTLPHRLAQQELVVDHLQQVIPVITETEALKQRIKSNGHFRNVLPPDLKW